MERFTINGIREFVHYAYGHDMQILANRRAGRVLFNKALLDAEGAAPEDLFEFPEEKAGKIASFLELNEAQRDGQTVSTYAFVRLVSDLRISLRNATGRSTPQTTPSSTPRAQEPGAPPPPNPFSGFGRAAQMPAPQGPLGLGALPHPGQVPFE
jgi:hypothetical protein